MSFPGALFPETPAPGLQRELAAYSGVWEGKWGNILHSRLAVERIAASSAVVVYAWGDHPSGAFKTGWVRTQAVVLADWTITWGTEVKLSFKIGRDLQSVEGIRVTKSDVSSVTMYPCSMS
jgi:hypothetical protein